MVINKNRTGLLREDILEFENRKTQKTAYADDVLVIIDLFLGDSVIFPSTTHISNSKTNLLHKSP